MISASAIGLIALLVTGCASDPTPEPEPEPEVLSASVAGGRYLDAVCPVNEAWDEADVEIDRLRIAQARGESDTRLFAEAMRRVGQQSAAAAEALDLEDSDEAWPADAETAIGRVEQSLRADAKEAEKAAKLPIGEAAGYAWQGSDAAAASAAEARAALGLPEDAVTACAQWAEQQAAAE